VPIVPVDIPSARYDVLVDAGALASAGQRLSGLTKSKKIAVVTDSNVGPLHLQALEQSLRAAGFEVVVATIPAGEEHKNLATIASIFDQLLPAKLDRSTPVVALGGGVVGDMAGFVAATLLRGVPFVQIPTTLLAMVDASVGGKTGVDHAVGKNLIGAFHQPFVALIDPQVLRTLPLRELRGGLAECIKHDIIRDADHFVTLERNIARALQLDVAFLTELIAHNVAIKAKVVAADPLEKGERAHLNFGHTFGHAIEAASKFSYSHGESVSLGMIAAARAAARLGMLDEASVQRIARVIAAADLPTGGIKLEVSEVIETMHFDKKVAAGKIRFVLPDRIGHVVIRDDVPMEVVRWALHTLVD
jgi:3-dehydroquinate synthase